MKQKALLSRLEELIQDGESVRATARLLSQHSSFKYVDSEPFVRWKTSCLAFLETNFKATSYLKSFTDGVRNRLLGCNEHGIAVLNALKDDLVKGYLYSVEEEKVKKSEVVNYVDEERIKELTSLPKDKFDTTKLVELCEQLNQNYKWNNYFAVGALLRTILHHVPPIFGMKEFKHVASDYSWGKSHKNRIMKLFESAKDIADNLLHEHIRKLEVLPKKPRVDFKAELDILLAEIVTILKT